jgi:quinol monooxygenase YgiN
MKKILGIGVLLGIFCSLLLLGSFTGNQAVKEETLTIVATVTVKPEFKDDVLKAIKTVVDATRKEPGNIFYDVFEDVKNPSKFVFIETWKSQAAIDFHNKTAHFNDFVKAVEGKASLEASILRQKF